MALSSSLYQHKFLSIFLELSQYPLAKCEVRLSRLYLLYVLCTQKLRLWQTLRGRERVPERVGRNVLSIKMFEPDNKSTPGSCKL